MAMVFFCFLGSLGMVGFAAGGAGVMDRSHQTLQGTGQGEEETKEETGEETGPNQAKA